MYFIVCFMQIFLTCPNWSSPLPLAMIISIAVFHLWFKLSFLHHAQFACVWIFNWEMCTSSSVTYTFPPTRSKNWIKLDNNKKKHFTLNCKDGRLNCEIDMQCKNDQYISVNFSIKSWRRELMRISLNQLIFEGGS